MNFLSMQVWQWVAAIGTAVLMFIGALLAPASLKARLAKYRWWFVGLAVLVLAYVFLVALPRREPPGRFPASALPEMFRPGYWAWVFAFLMGMLGAGLAVFVQLRGAGRTAGLEALDGGFPDLDAAWDEIGARLSQAKIDAASQRYYLLLAPTEDDAAALIDAAGLQVFAQGPAGPSPIHAYATSEGILLSCAGACHFGTPGDPEAVARLEHLAQRFLALKPDCAVVRGVVVLLPMPWCARPESVREASAIRDDLQTLQRVLGVQPPAFAVFTGIQSVPGLDEFTRRIAAQVSPQMLDQRVGFAVPSTHEFSGDLVQRGLIWQSGWLRVWTLNLLAGDPTNHRGNGELYLFDAEFRRYRRRLRSILESAFSTHRESEPVLFRGCYFVADGNGRQERAFAAGLLRGSRSRIVADHVAADWTEEAARADRRYGLAALGVGLVGGLPCLAVWLFIIARLPVVGWAGLLGLLVAWGLGIVWMFRH